MLTGEEAGFEGEHGEGGEEEEEGGEEDEEGGEEDEQGAEDKAVVCGRVFLIAFLVLCVHEWGTLGPYPFFF